MRASLNSTRPPRSAQKRAASQPLRPCSCRTCRPLIGTMQPSSLAPELRNPGRAGFMRLRNLGLAALLLLFWISLIDVPRFVGGPNEKGEYWSHGLTSSWEQALAFFFQHRYQAGRDFIFTYGPLGFLAGGTFDPFIYWLKYAWEASVTLFAAFIFLKVWLRLPAWPARVLLAYLVLCQGIHPVDVRFPLLLLMGGLLALECRRITSFWCLTLLMFALLSLMKFTFFVLAVFIVGTLTVDYAASRRFLLAATMPAAFVGFLLTAWAALGQFVSGIPAYLRGAWEITSGYADAMGWPIADHQPILGLLAIASLAALWFVAGAAPARRRRGALSLMTGALFLQWRHGFTRGDHTRFFFEFILFVPFLISTGLGPRPTRCWPRRIFSVATIALGLAGFMTGPDADRWSVLGPWNLYRTSNSDTATALDRVQFLLAPVTVEQRLRAEWEKDRARPLFPKIKGMVGDAPVDLLSHHQGVIFSQQMNWRPRPVFQSYSAYTPFLLDANRDFFRSERAPQYVIVTSPSLDRKLYALEDSQAYFEILRRFRPVLIEGSTILLQRDSSAQACPKAVENVLMRREVRQGEIVNVDNLPAAYQTLSVRLRKTWWGRLRGLLYRPPWIWINLWCDDGRRLYRRLVPGMASEDFVLNPLFDQPNDLLALYAPARGVRVKSFAISVVGDKSCYEDEMTIVLKSVSNLVCRPLSSKELQQLLRGAGEREAAADSQSFP